MGSDFRRADHLPKRRAGGRPDDDPYELPRQRRGRTPQMHGRYPDFDVLEQAQELAHALPGDPARGQIIRNALKGKIDELVNR